MPRRNRQYLQTPEVIAFCLGASSEFLARWAQRAHQARAALFSRSQSLCRIKGKMVWQARFV